MVKRLQQEQEPGNFSAGVTYQDASWNRRIYREHGLDEWVINYTSRGRAVVGRGAEEFAEETGDLLLVPPGARHDYGHAPGSEWEHLWARFQPRPEWVELLQWPAMPGGVCLLRLPEAEERARIEGLFRKMIALFAGPLRRRFDFAMNALEEILLRCDLHNPRSFEARLDPRILAAMHYLCRNYRNRLMVEDVAAACNLSASRLGHLFLRETATTPMRYLERYRVDRAKELLLMTSRSVAEIAVETGFECQFYFSRVFRKVEGKSPAAFRGRTGHGKTAAGRNRK